MLTGFDLNTLKYLNETNNTFQIEISPKIADGYIKIHSDV